MKNIFKYIFIYTLCILFVGCDSNIMSSDNCDYCHLELEAVNLPQDENGYYHLDFNNNSLQTYAQLRAYVGYEYEYVGWTTDASFEGCTWDYCEDIPIINGSSWSSEDGYAYQIMGVYEENIGDIATIYVGYYDDYGNQWLDSIKVIIDE